MPQHSIPYITFFIQSDLYKANCGEYIYPIAFKNVGNKITVG